MITADDCGEESSCAGYTMTGSYYTHAQETGVREQDESVTAMIWDAHEYIDIALELDLPRHLNTH